MVPSNYGNYVSDISGLNALVKIFSMKKIKFLSKLFKCHVKLLWLLSRRPVTSKFASVLAKQSKYFCHHSPPPIFCHIELIAYLGLKVNLVFISATNLEYFFFLFIFLFFFFFLLNLKLLFVLVLFIYCK